MLSRNALIFAISSGLLLGIPGGVLMADQGAAVQNGRHARAGRVDRMSATLGLTDQQKTEAKAIFKSERETARPVRQELFAERKAVREAIESGKAQGVVEQLARNEGPTLGKLAGMRADAFAKFYAELTPAQQQKAAGLHQEWRQHHAAKSQS